MDFPQVFLLRDGPETVSVLVAFKTMKDYAKEFYKSQAWKKLRDRYIRSVGGLCERCYKRGEIRPAEIVHHKVRITPENITDPGVTLSMENLEALCRPCHEREHKRAPARYEVDAFGKVTAIE